jgi:hypothetical protein
MAWRGQPYSQTARVLIFPRQLRSICLPIRTTLLEWGRPQGVNEHNYLKRQGLGLHAVIVRTSKFVLAKSGLLEASVAGA